MRTARVFAALAAALLAACRSTPYREVEIDLQAAEPGELALAGAPREGLRFSVAAMQSARSTYAAYSPLAARIGRLVDADVELVQRRTYGEVNDLLADGYLDLAFICTGAWLELQRAAPGTAEILAVPIIRGMASYHSYVIVPAGSEAASFDDLRGRRFAFTDELSLTGHAYPIYFLSERHAAPGGFFAGTIYTNSHDRSILAVAASLVDGAAVDGLIYQDLLDERPELADELRVVHRSPAFGIPPFVASTRLPAATRQRLRSVLLSLHEDPEASVALARLHIDRFVAPAADAYESAAEVVAVRR